MSEFYRRQALLLGKVIRWADAGRVYRVRGVLALRTAYELAERGLVFLEELPPEPESRIRYFGLRPTEEGQAVWRDYGRAPRYAFRHGGDRRSPSFRAAAQRGGNSEQRASGTAGGLDTHYDAQRASTALARAPAIMVGRSRR